MCLCVKEGFSRGYLVFLVLSGTFLVGLVCVVYGRMASLFKAVWYFLNSFFVILVLSGTFWYFWYFSCGVTAWGRGKDGISI